MRIIKKIMFIFVLNVILLTTSYAKEFKVNSKYIVLYNLNDDKVIYEQEKDKVIKVASLTKIMTCIVAIENIKNLNEKVLITQEAFNETNGLAKAGFKIGSKVTYYDLLHGAMLPSGADATNALAISIAGSIDNYVKMMNDKAKELNLNNTHFINTTGLDAKEHYSTVDDIAKLLKYALKNKTFKKIFTTKNYQTSDGLLNFKSTILKNAERYNIDISIIKGSKTGFTDEAGLCMASIATLSDIDYLLVTCKANSNESTPHQILDAITIYNYYNTNYGYVKILSKNQELITIDVDSSNIKNITFKSNKDVKKYLNKNIDTSLIKFEYKGLNSLSPKNKMGDYVGTLYLKYQDELLYSYDIYLNKKIESNLIDKIGIISLIGIEVIFITLILFIIIKL